MLASAYVIHLSITKLLVFFFFGGKDCIFDYSVRVCLQLSVTESIKRISLTNMGNSSSLMLQEDEIQTISAETGCKPHHFSLKFTSFSLEFVSLRTKE